ncbi:branched-chain amino acid ABC transporter permease [Microbacterium chocolatum]|uniref:branched-chain amino acid ABC transporter permease n=1 Tax=Microbacterium aurantiacum TaxID=162393 RepID=UPI00338EBEB5
MDPTLLAQLVLNGIVTGVQLAVLGLGMSLILNVAQRFHFAYSLTITLAAFVAALLARIGTPSILAALAGVVAAAALGGAIELILYRPLARRSGDAALLPIFVTALGLSIGGQSLIQFLWARESTSLPYELVPVEIIGLPFGLRLTTLDLVTLAIFGAIAAAGVAVLRYSRAGQVIRGVRVNPTMAAVVGIRPESVFVMIFIVASAASGLAGVFAAARYSATPSMGYDPMFAAFVIAFLAGATAPGLRVVLIGIALGIVQVVSALWIPSNLTNIVVFGCLFVYLVLKGAGVLHARTPATARS